MAEKKDKSASELRSIPFLSASVSTALLCVFSQGALFKKLLYQEVEIQKSERKSPLNMQGFISQALCF